MRCPECKSNDTKIFDSRTKGDRQWRRHECENGHRFTTWEILEADMPGPTDADIDRVVIKAIAQIVPDLIDRIIAGIKQGATP